INDKLTAGTRLEWWKAGGGGFSSLGAGLGSFDVYAITAGLNIKPMDHIMIRPEVRHDWTPDIAGLAGSDSINYTTAAVDVILSF
ncbi:MAG TPA: outer membrane beta-barrel protein, partial [Planctomycetaceae bacterium]|nr:outer membrane beta-barrel protein [Planctomycetaceae bacterium]